MNIAVDLALWLAFVLSVSSHETFKGIKMCRSDCEKTAGCRSIHYDPVHLKCQLQFDTEDTEETSSTAITQAVTETNAANDLAKCLKTERLIYTRQNTPSCVQNTAVKSESDDPSLLLAASVKKLLKFNINTNAVEEVAFPWKIHCSAYWKKEKRLLLGVDEGIISTSTTQKKITLFKRRGVQKIFIDENRNLTFVVCCSNRKSLYRMNMKGKYVKPIVRLAESMFKVTIINQKNSRIYSISHRHLFIFSYNGTMIKDMYSSDFISGDAMSYDPEQDIICLASGSGIYLINTKGSVITEINSRVGRACSMAVHGNYVFVSDFSSRDEIRKIDIKGESQEQVFNIRKKDKTGFPFPFQILLDV